jgi:hypothetical protein
MTASTTNPLFDNDRLITAAGQVDRDFVRASARARAESLYGADRTDLDIAYWQEKLTATAEAMAEVAARPAAAPTRVQVRARHLQPGDRVGSGEIVRGVSAGIRTPSGKVEVSLEKAGRRRLAIWGGSTLINVQREVA